MTLEYRFGVIFEFVVSSLAKLMGEKGKMHDF